MTFENRKDIPVEYTWDLTAIYADEKAFDKEYDDSKSDEAKKYKENLYSICQKYSHLASMSFIYDYKNLLDKKDSPIDKGKEIYERLYLDRTKVRW